MVLGAVAGTSVEPEESPAIEDADARAGMFENGRAARQTMMTAGGRSWLPPGEDPDEYFRDGAERGYSQAKATLARQRTEGATAPEI